MELENFVLWLTYHDTHLFLLCGAKRNSMDPPDTLTLRSSRNDYQLFSHYFTSAAFSNEKTNLLTVRFLKYKSKSNKGNKSTFQSFITSETVH